MTSRDSRALRSQASTPSAASAPPTPFVFIAPWVSVLVLLATVAVAAFADSTIGSLTGLTVAAFGALILAAMALLRPSRHTLPAVVWALAAPALVILVRALFTAPVGYSLVGLRTLPQGAALWIVAWAWLAAFALLPSYALARMTTIAVAATGALAAVLGLWQEYNQSLASRVAAGGSSESIGIFVSSNALGQFAVLAIACGVAWFAVSRTTMGKIAAATCTALSFGGLAVSISRGSWAAGCIGVGIAWLATRKTKPALTASALLGATIIGAAALFKAASGIFGAGLAARLDSALNGRAVIWSRALTQWGRAFLLGEGPARFGTYGEWEFDPQFLDGVDAYGTFDPHSVPLAFAVSGGLVALLVLLVAVGYAAVVIAKGVSGGTRLAQAALVGGLAAWALVQIIEITEVVPLITAAALAGLLLGRFGAEQGGAKRKIRPWLVAHAGGLTAGILALAMVFPLAGALRDATAYGNLEKTRTVDAAAAYDYWTRTGDPSYATDHLAPIIAAAANGDQPALSDDAQMLASSLEPAMSWYIDAARMSAFAWALPTAASPQGDAARMRATVEAGREADPGNDAMWDLVEKNNAAIMKAWPVQ